MMLLSFILLVGLSGSSFIVNEAFAEESILVLESNASHDLDGKWTFVSEWKESAYTGLGYNNGGKLILRTSHDRNYINILVNHLGDTFPNKGEDRATICLNSKNKNPEKDNYCFIVTLGRNNPIVLQESSSHTIKSNFKRIFKTEFEGMSDVTVTDRYSVVPHVTYEFKIPVDLVGRSNEYQFYVAVYESQNNYILTWPKYTTLKNNFDIPDTSNWGTMISPDSSLPEFHSSYFVFFLPFLMIIILRQKWSKLVNFT